ncbi:phage shock protein PspA [Pseudoalteromonas sp. McH1-7]|uniref:Phage shock protein A n=1 Tax=Pseudoalteromonas peptidolytica F12-50-A1 TaxID=1315280 RepID=A0A8I0MUY9_9GAMM|nr:MULTISPECIES: phage shock protein PspA [Pseudoalteromonas]MBE0345821.1 phage shock protein A [Pseudoalteromonas peptidolytica F12-50-A1]MDW7547906.1 phage shock protein PspA [Pseudoalteromonas peptidolytica]NLR17127.1 phage shock protein PspA [Pseudoalteromonas peptidolytica]NUZ11102.1 phage shock protein PspA [Pseudoalteromonas sp. McH1-7]RRS07450.1 phage shock protein PspA [Pseudoalteromonas sp. J010]
MGIFSRFADIVNSNINAILDKAEDPEKMVRLIIQEMEDTLVEVRSTSAKTLAEKKELTRRLDQLKAQVDDWQTKAELALSKEREDLARAALLEKQKSAEDVAALEKELAHVDTHIEKLQQEVSTLQDKLADAKARQKAIVLRQRSAESRLEVKKALDSSKVDDALNRFERYESKIDGLESQIESYDLGKKSLADEIADLQKNEKIDDELEQLKKKMAEK